MGDIITYSISKHGQEKDPQAYLMDIETLKLTAEDKIQKKNDQKRHIIYRKKVMSCRKKSHIISIREKQS